MNIRNFNALQIAAGIRSGDFSAEKAMRDVLLQAKLVQKQCNAFITLEETSALKQARFADWPLKSYAPEALRPLHGVPFSVKELLNTEGMSTTFGSRALEHNIPEENVAAVSRIRKAGAILIGKTATSEFASKIRTNSLLNGVTRNPWNPTLSPSGSSGGAGVASCASPFDICTDGAGSSRIPAAACGILSLMPTLGSRPHESWPFHYGNKGTIAINCRSTEDCVDAPIQN